MPVCVVRVFVYTVATKRESLTSRGSRLAALRLEANLTQQELADVVGTTQATISRIEGGKQGMTEMLKVKIAAALGMGPDEVWPYLTLGEADMEPMGQAASR